MTADDLLALPSDNRARHELVAGELRTMPLYEWRHGKVVDNISALLGVFIHEKQLGCMFAGGTGFLLQRDPDTVRAPAYAFVNNEHRSSGTIGETFWPGAPDLAVEVVSTEDTAGDMSEKTEQWLAAGCASVWVVDPKLQTVTICRSSTDVQVKTCGEFLVGDPVVPGFACAVDELFL